MSALAATLDRIARVVEDMRTAPARAEAARKQRGEVAAFEAGYLASACREHADVVEVLVRHLREDINKNNEENE